MESGATIYTDEHRGYRGLKKDYEHSAVCHSVGEYVRGECHTNGIESVWALLKRGYMGIYHHWSAKHLDRYVNEFAYRQSTIKMETIAVFSDMFYKADGRRLTYKRLINATS